MDDVKQEGATLKKSESKIAPFILFISIILSIPAGMSQGGPGPFSDISQMLGVLIFSGPIWLAISLFVVGRFLKNESRIFFLRVVSFFYVYFLILYFSSDPIARLGLYGAIFYLGIFLPLQRLFLATKELILELRETTEQEKNISAWTSFNNKLSSILFISCFVLYFFSSYLSFYPSLSPLKSDNVLDAFSTMALLLPLTRYLGSKLDTKKSMLIVSYFPYVYILLLFLISVSLK